MNPEVKSQWLSALRSGEYQQGRNSLRCDDKFCCLGILCDLHRRHNPIQECKLDWKKNDWGHYHFDGCNSVLPKSVREWAGLDECNPVVSCYRPRKTLAAMNDGGFDFSEIADVIEKNL